MNIQEVYNLLQDCLAKLQSANIDDMAKIDLEILISQLKKQIIIGAFDPLKDLNTVTVADVTSLPKLISKVDGVIRDEKNRTELVNKIVSIAKIALKAAGLPLPS